MRYSKEQKSNSTKIVGKVLIFKDNSCKTKTVFAKEIIEMHNNKASVSEISKKYDVRYNYVWNIIHAHSVRMEKRKNNQPLIVKNILIPNIDGVFDKYIRGVSIKELSKIYGCKIHTMRIFLEERIDKGMQNNELYQMIMTDYNNGTEIYELLHKYRYINRRVLSRILASCGTKQRKPSSKFQILKDKIMKFFNKKEQLNKRYI